MFSNQVRTNSEKERDVKTATAKVRPQHQVAENQVSVPTIVETELNAGDAKLRSIFVQWFGETDGPLKLNGEQFFFDTMLRPDDPLWRGKHQTFRVVFLGPIKNWPKPSAIPALKRMAKGNEDANIVWLLSPLANPADPSMPLSPSMQVVLLGDPNYGVIRPRPFCDMSVRDQVMAEFESNLPLAEKLLRNPNAELPPEDMPWEDSPQSCQFCEDFKRSCDTRPAVPENGSVHDLAYLCLHCGRRWWQFNDYFHLWKHVTNRAEWEFIRRQWILKKSGYEFPEQ